MFTPYAHFVSRTTFALTAAVFGRNLQTHRCLQPKVGMVWTAGKGKPLPLVFIFIAAKCSCWLALVCFLLLFWFVPPPPFFFKLPFFSFQLGSWGKQRRNELRAGERVLHGWASFGEEIRLKLERPGQIQQQYWEALKCVILTVNRSGENS